MKLRVAFTKKAGLAGLICLLGGVFLVTGCGGLPSRAPVYEPLDVPDAYTMIQENQRNSNFVIIDIRLPQEFALGHIAGAINLDKDAPNYRDELSKLNKKKTYLVYFDCSCGGVAWKTVYLMRDMGFRRVYNMWEGLQAWKEAGLPVAT